MATRCLIGLEMPDLVNKGKVDTVDFIYCHYDGYPNHTGYCLLEHYGEPTKVKELIDIGSIPSLESTVELTKKDSYGEPAKSTFNRSSFKNIAKQSGAEYAYLYTLEGKWLWISLIQVMKAGEVTFEFTEWSELWGGKV